MSRRLQENIIAAVILLVLAAVIYACLGYGPRARTVPIPIAVFGIVLMVIQIVWQNLRPAGELNVDLLEVLTRRDKVPTVTTKVKSPDNESAKHGSAWRKETIAYGMVVLFTAMVLLAGPIPAMFVFIAGYFLLSGHYAWRRALAYTVIFTVAIYLLFVVALEVQLYHGLLEPLFRRS